ncbi:MAG: CDP-alcohol phosphatidyltransferase family protein [Gammaproteobacteria bacterium]|nr:CDP-alcohol phosphatidyltransferase family protein [Gammaproteobacteria bacterium]
MKARDIPNLICVLRILLVPPIVMGLLRGEFATVLLLFALAGGSDGLDGFLARRYEWRSRLGAILDPLADKLLMVCTYATLGWLGLLPWWLVALVLGRDGVIVSGALAYHRLCGEIEMAPSRISKANTLLQILLVMLLLLLPLGLAVPGWVMVGMIALVTVTTLLSGGDYVREWGRQARRCQRRGGVGDE